MKFSTASLAILLVSLISPCTAGSNEKSLEWLATKRVEEGVINLPSGLSYKVLRKGDGAFHPTASSPCDCHYAGTLTDGTKFDSSYDRGSPTTFAPNQVIKGWTEAMQLMVEGDKWEMYIPSELGYGDRGSPPKIGGGDALVFTMEIIAIKGDKVPAARCDPATLEGCNEKEAKFVAKAKGKYQGAEAYAAEITRLGGMDAGKMKPELQEWIQRRLAILRQLKEAASKNEL